MATTAFSTGSVASKTSLHTRSPKGINALMHAAEPLSLGDFVLLDHSPSQPVELVIDGWVGSIILLYHFPKDINSGRLVVPWQLCDHMLKYHAKGICCHTLIRSMQPVDPELILGEPWHLEQGRQ